MRRVVRAGPAASLLQKTAYVYRQPTTDHAVKVGLGFLTKQVEAIFGSPKGKIAFNKKAYANDLKGSTKTME
jgi:hypothetical protein